MTAREAYYREDWNSSYARAVYNGAPAALTWDVDHLQMCVCDDGWEGFDCSQRTCPMGWDSSQQYAGFEVQGFTTDMPNTAQLAHEQQEIRFDTAPTGTQTHVGYSLSFTISDGSTTHELMVSPPACTYAWICATGNSVSISLNDIVNAATSAAVKTIFDNRFYIMFSGFPPTIVNLVRTGSGYGPAITVTFDIQWSSVATRGTLPMLVASCPVTIGVTCAPWTISSSTSPTLYPFPEVQRIRIKKVGVPITINSIVLDTAFGCTYCHTKTSESIASGVGEITTGSTASTATKIQNLLNSLANVGSNGVTVSAMAVEDNPLFEYYLVTFVTVRLLGDVPLLSITCSGGGVTCDSTEMNPGYVPASMTPYEITGSYSRAGSVGDPRQPSAAEAALAGEANLVLLETGIAATVSFTMSVYMDVSDLTVAISTAYAVPAAGIAVGISGGFAPGTNSYSFRWGIKFVGSQHARIRGNLPMIALSGITTTSFMTQPVVTTMSEGEFIGGTFPVSFKYRTAAGSIATTPDVTLNWYDTAASAQSKIIAGTSGLIGNVVVSRSPVSLGAATLAVSLDWRGGYRWLVTFSSIPEDVPTIPTYSAPVSLTGTGATLSSFVQTDGNDNQIQTPEVQLINCKCASSVSAYLTFRGEKTGVLTDASSTAAVKSALEALSVVPSVTVNMLGASTLCSAAGTTTAITFTHNPGPQPPLHIADPAADAVIPVGCIFNIQTGQHHEVVGLYGSTPPTAQKGEYSLMPAHRHMMRREVQLIECKCSSPSSVSVTLTHLGKTTGSMPGGFDSGQVSVEMSNALWPSVGIVMYGDTQLCSATGTTTSIRFYASEGPQSSITIAAMTLPVGCSLSIKTAGSSGVQGLYGGTARKGTHRVRPCSGRGTCNADGTCTCSAASFTSGNNGGASSVTTGTKIYDNCAHITTTPSSCPGPLAAPCSGHGVCDTTSYTCICDRSWAGHDCSMLTCASHSSWAIGPDNYARVHDEAECSNMGYCDYTWGNCRCEKGFAGMACNLMDCPRGTGAVVSDTFTAENDLCPLGQRCATLTMLSEELFVDPYYDAIGTAAVRYPSLWDADMIRGCFCGTDTIHTGPNSYASSYRTGVDCLSRTCPFGPDPLATEDTDGTVYEVQSITCTAATTDSGWFFLSFRGIKSSWLHPDSFIFEADETALQQSSHRMSLEYAFQTLANVTGPVTISVSSPSGATRICSDVGSGVQIHVTFPYLIGDPPMLRAVDKGFQTSAFVDDGRLVIAEVTKGTRIGYECNRRGVCDRSTGRCKCQPQFGSSDGAFNVGETGDCGHKDAFYSFTREVASKETRFHPGTAGAVHGLPI
jgi:hypothetical protein